MPQPRRTRSNPTGAPPSPPPPLTGLVVKRTVESFSPYPLGHVVDGWALYSRWVRVRGGSPKLYEQWAKAPEGYQALLAWKRWRRYHSPTALASRRRRAEIDRARREGAPEWEVQQRFGVVPKRQGRKRAESAGLPLDPTLGPAQPENRFLGDHRPWLWDPEFRPHWLTFLRLRRQCPTEADYRLLIDMTRPHAEAALARWDALRAEVGSRTVLSRPGGFRRPLPRRRWDPGTLSTDLRAMWPSSDTSSREASEDSDGSCGTARARPAEERAGPAAARKSSPT